MEKVGNGYGFGKIILFGEHFVVYGLPAIASAIGDQTLAKVETSNKYELIDNRPATEGYKDKKQGEMERSMKLILDYMKIDIEKTPVKITLSGNLFCTSGVGASAAMATSIARAFSEYFDLGLSDDEVNRISYEGEKGSAGAPSGIDNTCATFGGLLWFKKNLEGGENTIDLIEIKSPIRIVLGNTGLSSVTSEVVGDVREEKEKNPEKYEKIFSEYVDLARKGKEALVNQDMDKIAELMNRNHELLQDIGVSCKELDHLVDLAKKNGATAAKLTGTGRGGYMIALTPDKDSQNSVAEAIDKDGFKVLKTTVG